MQAQAGARRVELVDVAARQRVGAPGHGDRQLAPVARRETLEHGRAPRRVVAEGGIEHRDAARAQARHVVDDGQRRGRRIGVPPRPSGAQQARRGVVRAAAAEKQGQLGEPLGDVRIRGVVGQVRRVERQRRALERPAGLGVPVPGGHRAGHGDHCRLRLADDEPVEGCALVSKVVRADRHVLAFDGDDGAGLRAPHLLGHEHGGAVLERRPARDHDEVGRASGDERRRAARERLARRIAGRAAELHLEVEHVGDMSCAPQLRRQRHELRLHARARSPRPAVQGRGEHEEDASLRHLTPIATRAARGTPRSIRHKRLCTAARARKRGSGAAPGAAAVASRGSRAGAASRGTP